MKKTPKKAIKLNKAKIFNSIVLITDIILIIYLAKKNSIQSVSVLGKKPIFIGNKRKLIFGKNYITIITTAFFYIYSLIGNKFLLHKKITKKYLIINLLSILLINILLFYIFTKRIY